MIFKQIALPLGVTLVMQSSMVYPMYDRKEYNLQTIIATSTLIINQLNLKYNRDIPFDIQKKSYVLIKKCALNKKIANNIEWGRKYTKIGYYNLVCDPARLNVEYQKTLSSYRAFIPILAQALNQTNRHQPQQTKQIKPIQRPSM